MSYCQCSVAGCSWTAWRACERCNKPYCDSHARWHQTEFVQETWGRWSTFTFVCYECVPCGVDGEDGPDHAAEAVPSVGIRLQQPSGRRYSASESKWEALVATRARRRLSRQVVR